MFGKLASDCSRVAVEQPKIVRATEWSSRLNCQARVLDLIKLAVKAGDGFPTGIYF